MKTATLIALFFTALNAAAAPDRQPNILWISTEDIRPRIGFLGDPRAIVPHLDQLAAEGVIYGPYDNTIIFF